MRYTFELAVTAGAAAGRTILSIRVPRAPWGGTLLYAPKAAVLAMDTFRLAEPVELSMRGWTADAHPANDAAEGLIGGLIWKLKTDYPKYCTLPHLIAIYQLLDTDSLIQFLEEI